MHFYLVDERHITFGEAMNPIRVRFSKFCDLIVGEDGPKATIRDILAKGDVPLDPTPKVGGQRTYDGEDLLKWLAFDELRAAGVRLHQAAKLMRYGYAAERFLESLAAGEEASDFYLFFAEGKPDPAKSSWYELHYKIFRRAEMCAFLADQAQTAPGIKYFVSVPMLPIYIEGQARAAAHNMQLIGGNLYETALQ